MANDPFAQFGGQTLAPTPADPFAEFGGQAHAEPEHPPAADPFAQFGGQVAGATPSPTQTQPTESSEGVGDQLLRGAGNALAKTVDPSGKLGLLPKDYYSHQRGGVEMLSELVTHFATGRGLATAGGALAGSVLGPAGAAGGAMLGNLLYGLYQGVGTEVSRSEAEHQDFNALRALGNTALEVNPLIKGGSALTAALRTIGQAAGQAATEYSYSKDPTAAGITGAVGLLLAYPMYKGIREVNPGLLPTQESLQATSRSFAGEMGSDVLQRTAARAAQATAELDPSDLGFQRFVTGAVDQPAKDVAGAYKRLTAAFTPEKLQDAWTKYQESNAFVDSLIDVAHEKATELGGKVANLDLRRYKDAWKPLEFVASRLDRLWGTNLEGKVQGVAKAKEVFQVKAATYFDEATRIDREARKLGLSRTDVGKALDGQLDKLSPEAQTKLTQLAMTDRDGKGEVSVLDAWRRLWNDARQDIQAAGYDIGNISNYVPMRSLRGVDLAEAFRDQYTALQKRALAGRTTIGKLTGEDADDFRAMAAKVLRKAPDELTDADFTTAAKAALEHSKTNPVYTPSAVFERLGSVPDTYREYDVGKLFTGYINGNFKAVHFDQPLKDVRTYISAYRAAGLTQAADYLERYMADVTGASSRGLAGQMRDAGVALRDAGRKLQGSDSAAVRGLGRATEGLPDFAAWANGLIYPSYLGFPNVKAPLRNMTQVVLKTVPEIGYANGSKWMFKAMWDLGAEMAEATKAGTNPFRVIEERLQQAGHVGQHIMANLDHDPTIASKARSAADWLNSKSMLLYAQTETLNRAITVKMGQEWAKAAAAGDQSALAALNRLAPGARNQIAASNLLQPENVDKLGHFLGSELIGRTQFRYGKELQSDFGRAMGPLFTMFTKWPTMVAADMLDGFGESKTRGVANVVTKYLAPYGALYAIQQAKDMSGGDPSTAYKVWVGDLPSAAPLDTITHPTKTMDVLGGPGLQLGREYLNALSEVGTNGSKAATLGRTALRHTVKSYIPGVSQVLNELDRWDNAAGSHQATTTRELINRITGGP